MKKRLTLFMSLALTMSLTACDGGKSNSVSENNLSTAQPGSTSTPNTSTPAPKENNGKIEDDNKDSKKNIVVSILAANDFYKQAKMKYEAAHPNTTIEFKEFANSGGVMSPAEVERYVKTTTTEILSGKGADLFALDTIDLPIDKYVSKKAFVNLDELMKKDSTFDPSLYYTNILENSKMNGGLYVLPTRFFLSLLFGDAVGIERAGVAIDDKNWTWSQFAETSKQLAAKGVHPFSLGSTPPEQMLNSLVSDNYAQLVDGANRKANFESKYFTDLLESVKSLYNDKIITAESVGPKGSNFYLSEIYNPKDYVARLGIYYTNGKIYQKPHAAGQKSGVAFGGLSKIAMNSNSTVKGTAWDFMKFLMSEEMQSMPELQENGRGFSVNKKINERQLVDLAAEVTNGKGAINTVKGGAVQVSEKDIQSLKTMVSEASLPVTLFNKVQTIIAEEAKAYFTGQKSAESVAKLIQNRVTTYLNE